MVCAASSTGRITRSAPGLRPIQTPTATPMTMTTAVATSVEARVAMLSCHSPVATSRPRHTAEPIAARIPPSTTESATTTAATSHHGEPVSSDCNGSTSTSVTTSLTPLVMPDRLLCTQSVAVVTPLAMELPTSTSGGNSAAHT